MAALVIYSWGRWIGETSVDFESSSAFHHTKIHYSPASSSPPYMSARVAQSWGASPGGFRLATGESGRRSRVQG
jgi:hypothetical protein